MIAKLKPRIILVLFLVLDLTASASTNPTPRNDKKINAEELVKKTERAVAFIVKSGQATKDANLKRSSKAAQPFWSSIKKLNTSVEKMNKYLFLKDDSFHTALSETVTIKEEVITTYELLGAQDSAVKEGLDKVSKAVDLLYQNYSKEAHRMKNGEALSSKEKEQLQKVKSQNKELQAKLDELETKVGNNKRMIKKLKKIREKSNQVSSCSNNAAGFFFAMSAMNMINGWMWGCHWWWGSWGGWYPGFYYGYVDVYVGVFDGYAYDWGYLDGVIDSYGYDLEVELATIELEIVDDYLNGYEADLYNSSYDYIEYDSSTYDLPSTMDSYDGYDMIDSYPAVESMDYIDDYSYDDYY